MTKRNFQNVLTKIVLNFMVLVSAVLFLTALFYVFTDRALAAFWFILGLLSVGFTAFLFLVNSVSFLTFENEGIRIYKRSKPKEYIPYDNIKNVFYEAGFPWRGVFYIETDQGDRVEIARVAEVGWSSKFEAQNISVKIKPHFNERDYPSWVPSLLIFLLVLLVANLLIILYLEKTF